MQNRDQDTEFPNDALVFHDLDQRNRYPTEANESLNIFTRFYDNGAHRYEEVCMNTFGMCDSLEQSDMFDQKADIQARATMNSAGYPAVFTERYNPPSGYIIRTYTSQVDAMVASMR